MTAISSIVLCGFSGSGKSSVARLLSAELGWQLVDTDADIERSAGMTVPEIFEKEGEPAFRALERRALLTALNTEHAVTATGGGAVVADELWTADALLRPGTLVVTLDAEPESILARLRLHHEKEGAGVARPMIAGDDPLGRIRTLKASRQTVYDRAHLTLIAERTEPETIVRELVTLVRGNGDKPAVTLRTSTAESRIFVETGLISRIGAIASGHWPKARKAWIVSDDKVGALHGPAVLDSLTSNGFDARLHTVPSGEGSKSWTTAGEVIGWMLDGGIERGDLVVALGGGVIGDLAGFVAATVLRGVALLQIPTSLLAMVDSSIGGKTGVNHRTGKNLIGAFYQPPVVAVDPALLGTLPRRELVGGWAEIIKHGVIQISTPGGERGDLLTFLERNHVNLSALRDPAISYLIARNIALKARVVEADEREQSIRAYLNFGHTMGHAIEASDYALLHGEAVGIGMRVAMRIARCQAMVDQELVDRVDSLIAAYGLPLTTTVNEATVFQKLMSDKKRVAGTQRWVLPLTGGGVEIRTDIPESAVRDALRQVITTS